MNPIVSPLTRCVRLQEFKIIKTGPQARVVGIVDEDE